VAPLFFLLIFGMIEFGRMGMVQQIITNRSREGARIAVSEGVKTDKVESAVNNYLTNASIFGGIVSVSPDLPDSASYGDPVAVTVSAAFDQVNWLGKPMSLGSGGSVLAYGRGLNLTATTVMRRETVE
jgi:Flp pilus assembly protein TadG